MPIAFTTDLLELQELARRVLGERGSVTAARAALDGKDHELPTMWAELGALGWFGVHVPAVHGGADGSVLELAVIAEEVGRALLPGPFLSTVVASTVVAAGGTPAQRAALLPGLADGSVTAGVGLASTVTWADDGLQGDAGVVLGAGAAKLLLIGAGEDVVLVRADAPGVTIASDGRLDPALPAARVTLVGLTVGPEAVLAGARRHALATLRTLGAAQAVGGATACVELAVAHALARVQFGRPIGSFQAVKHRCADMLVGAELAAATAWDAARGLEDAGTSAELAAAVAAAVAVPAFFDNAKALIQVLGGIGYTWEHDAHLYLRRAASLVAVLDGAAHDVADLRAAGVERSRSVDLPPHAEERRGEIRAFASRVRSLPVEQQVAGMVAGGYVHPHWPPPWGRGADAVEQLVIEQELADIPRPAYGIGEWIIPTVLEHGTPEQIERWIRPTVAGELVWCQMFSEPDAGSDAAAVRTRAVRVDGGWRVTGQKLWTSRAHQCDLGLATVRTDPAAAKHAGITTMVIDVGAVGVTIRPLRDITGDTPFNEIFLDEVFVPDDDVVGDVDGGWRVARATLGNERVTVGTQAEFGGQVDLLSLYRALPPGSSAMAGDVGDVLAHTAALGLLTLRAAQRAVAGDEQGVEGNITKLVRAETTQRSAELALRLLGPSAAIAAGPAAEVHEAFLHSRMATIASGTSEITRNQIGERILGLPREPGLR